LPHGIANFTLCRYFAPVSGDQPIDRDAACSRWRVRDGIGDLADNADDLLFVAAFGHDADRRFGTGLAHQEAALIATVLPPQNSSLKSSIGTTSPCTRQIPTRVVVDYLLALDALRDETESGVFNCGYGRGSSVREAPRWA
jgi:hypothetical protein